MIEYRCGWCKRAMPSMCSGFFLDHGLCVDDDMTRNQPTIVCSKTCAHEWIKSKENAHMQHEYMINRKRPSPGSPYAVQLAYVRECVEEAKAHPERAQVLQGHVYETILSYLRLNRTMKSLIDTAFEINVPEPISDPYERFVREQRPNARCVKDGDPVTTALRIGLGHDTLWVVTDGDQPIFLGSGWTPEAAWQNASRNV